MHTACGVWEGSEEVWGAPRVAGCRGEEDREALRWPGLWEEEAARDGVLCWVGPQEDWGVSRWASLAGEEVRGLSPWVGRRAMDAQGTSLCLERDGEEVRVPSLGVGRRGKDAQGMSLLVRWGEEFLGLLR